jgi:hypothetical protein
MEPTDARHGEPAQRHRADRRGFTDRPPLLALVAIASVAARLDLVLGGTRLVQACYAAGGRDAMIDAPGVRAGPVSDRRGVCSEAMRQVMFWGLFGLGAFAITACDRKAESPVDMKTFKRRMCDCKTIECGEKVAKEEEAWELRMEKEKPGEKKMEEADWREYDECRIKLGVTR